MAKKYVTGRVIGFNSTQTSATSLFVLARAMTASLVALTQAEHSPNGGVGKGPALPNLAETVSSARARVLSYCDALVARPVADLKATCLQRVAVLVHTVLLPEDLEDVARIRTSLAVARWVWQVPAPIEGYRLYNGVLDAVIDALIAYIDGPNAPQNPPAPTPVAPMEGDLWATNAAPVPVAHTALSNAFSGLLRDLDACVAADRRIQRDVVPDVFAAGFEQDLQAAELAREDLQARLTHLTSVPQERGLDRPLLLLARTLRAILSVEDDGDRMYIHAVMAENADLLMARGAHPAARTVRLLQAHFFKSVALLLSMDDYGGRGPKDDSPDAPELAA
jgi:hypothetical protein